MQPMCGCARSATCSPQASNLQLPSHILQFGWWGWSQWPQSSSLPGLCRTEAQAAYIVVHITRVPRCRVGLRMLTLALERSGGLRTRKSLHVVATTRLGPLDVALPPRGRRLRPSDEVPRAPLQRRVMLEVRPYAPSESSRLPQPPGPHYLSHQLSECVPLLPAAPPPPPLLSPRPRLHALHPYLAPLPSTTRTSRPLPAYMHARLLSAYMSLARGRRPLSEAGWCRRQLYQVHDRSQPPGAQ
mmetsp:Transcript_1563/g.5352  ORF Transcript_1563/g.5352 Transcript_1563/m.5352 type:complete len:243 (+) Transcript_1563:753-1481(+)